MTGNDNSRATTEAIATVKKLVLIYGIVGVLVLATVAGTTIAGGQVSSFMWIRAGILLLVTPVILGWASRAGAGQLKSLDRIRSVSIILPIAIVAVDLIPGMCPMWYTGLQGVSALALVAVAVLTRRGPLGAIRAAAKRPVGHR